MHIAYKSRDRTSRAGAGLDYFQSGSFICPASVVSYGHKYYLFFFINFIKKPPSPDPVAKGRRIPILQSLDLGSMVRFQAELGINMFFQFASDFSQARFTYPGDIRLIGFGLENPVINQSSSPFSSGLHLNLGAGVQRDFRWREFPPSRNRR